MTETETEHNRRIREYWASAYRGKNKSPVYDIGSLDFTKNNDDNDDNRLPFEPTAVLAPPNPKKR